MSLLISSTDKQLECGPLKATTANQECWGARDEERNDADLKMSAGVAFLIVILTILRTGVHDHAKGSLHIWTLAFWPCLFRVELVGIGKKLKRLKKPCGCWKDGSSLWGNRLNLGRPRHSFGKAWGSLSFWRDYRSGHHNLPSAIATATRPAELRGEVRQHVTLFFAVIIFASQPMSQEVTGRMKWEEVTAVNHYELWSWKWWFGIEHW